MTTSSNSAGNVQAAKQLQKELQGTIKPVLTTGLTGIVDLLVEITKKQQEIETRLTNIEHQITIATVNSANSFPDT